MAHSTLEDELEHEVWRRDISSVHRLLKAGANPNKPGRAWSSAIACAGENDETGEIARLLVEAGADINLQNEHGLTPLHYAVDMAIDGAAQQELDAIDWSVVSVFLDLGADPTIRDIDGETVYDLALAYGQDARNSFDAFMDSRNMGTSGQLGSET